MMLLQINPAKLLDVAGVCGPLTYFLAAAAIVGTLVAIYMFREWRKESKLKDAKIAALGDRIIEIKEEDANRSLLNLEVFNKLTDALDKILVDDRENAEAIKGMIKEIRTEINSNKELLMMKMEHVEDLVSNGKV